VAFDREGTLRNAEALLRQGKLDLAVVEYRAVIEDQPSDWNTANTLGDLYFRSGQTEKALAEYNRIADHLAGEGFFQKAVALYRKILKIKPDEEIAMWQLGQIAARQGLLVDARSSFHALAELRRSRGDRRGEAEARVRLGDLDGADLETRLAGARARGDLGQVNAAVQQLKQLAIDLQEKGREADALVVLSEASFLAPDDVELKRSLMNAHAARGDFDAARGFATSADELKEVAEELYRQGREEEALGVLAASAQADPLDAAIRATLVRAFITRGDMEGARGLLTAEVAGSDPELLWRFAEMALRDGRIQEGTDALYRILAEDPGRRGGLVILGCSVAEVNADAGYECIEVAASAAIAADEWSSAAAALNEFVNRVPNHIGALMRLVEICVDGGLDTSMHRAQAKLADAYLVLGLGAEARVLAEDLVVHQPSERSNIERFRQVLMLLGESDVDAIIAETLSGQAPAEPMAGTPPAPVAVVPASGAEAVSETPAPPSRHAIDLSGLFDADEPIAEPLKASVSSQEIDLSGALFDMDSGQTKAASPPPPASIESVLDTMRDEAVHEAATSEMAEQHLNLATAYIGMGMTDDAMKALEVAARSPRHRFRAGALLAQLYLDTGAGSQAIEWFERAADSPSPSPAAAHQLLYELASALEVQGETSRALAVFLELQAEAGEYRDLAVRLERLTKVQAGS
jgi:tetratricopeptide (TPR) repeat protein